MKKVLFVVMSFVSFLPLVASAHFEGPHNIGFLQNFLHFLISPSHLLVIIGIGLTLMVTARFVRRSMTFKLTGGGLTVLASLLLLL